MILYFSGSGNSFNVADKIASATHQRLVAIDDLTRNAVDTIEFSHGEFLGIVCGVHFFGLPAIVADFISGVHFRGIPVYSFSVLTFGTMTGSAGFQLKKLLSIKGIKLNARFSVKMVDTWTPMFNLSDKAKTVEITHKAQQHIERIANMIAMRKTGKFDHAALPSWIGKLYYTTYPSHRRTVKFHVMVERCVSCGLCACNCPVHAIEMSELKHPVWEAQQCTLCLRCLHHCPSAAIQYGSRTLRHGQFVNPYSR